MSVLDSMLEPLDNSRPLGIRPGSGNALQTPDYFPVLQTLSVCSGINLCCCSGPAVVWTYLHSSILTPWTP